MSSPEYDDDGPAPVGWFVAWWRRWRTRPVDWQTDYPEMIDRGGHVRMRRP